MGFFKKIFKPVRKVLDKVIPNEIKPALPYLAAFTPFLAPTSGIFGTMAGRALLSGAANIGAQLAQEGTTEDDLNLLSAGIAAATGALSAPQVSKGITTSPKEFFGMRADLASEGTGILSKAKELGFKGLSKGAGFLSTAEGSGGVGDILRPGGTKLGLDMASATAVGIPAAQGTGDAMYSEAVRLNKQQIIDDALSGLGEGATDAMRGDAIRLAMLQYGFSEDEIAETIASAGYKAGGRVGFKNAGLAGLLGGAKEKESKYITKKSDTSETDTINRIYEEQGSDGLSAYLDRNPDLKDKYVIVADGMSGELTIMPNKLHPDFMDTENIIMLKSGDGGNIIDMSSMFEEKKAKGGRIGVEEGGLMNLGGKEMDLRGGGFVPIGKKERADDVPARLSKNEFVMTADAVRAAGGGSVNKGAKRMYDLMNNLEARV